MGIDKKGVEEVYVKAIQDMYTDCKTAVRTHVGTTASFEVGVGLHQGSVNAAHYYYGCNSREHRQNTTRAMLFADDLELCEEKIK